MEFTTKVNISDYPFRISYGDGVMTIGSCFADNISAKMREAKMKVFSNPLGVVYNPLSIIETLNIIESGRPLPEDNFVWDGELWFDFALHGSFSSPDRGELLRRAEEAVTTAADSFRESKYIFITLGSAFVYELAGTGRVVANCHKMAAKNFIRRRMTVEEIVSAFGGLIERAAYADKRIIFTVSPVRHSRDGLVENQFSKSTLVVAANTLAEMYGNVSYFPSYEIVMDELRDYRFYREDMIHPSDVALGYIWERFSAAMLEGEALRLAARMEKLNAAMRHRPFNPSAESHKKFRNITLAEVMKLGEDYPSVDFTAEKKYFSE